MKKAGDKTLKGAKLGMGNLHKHILGSDIEGIVYIRQVELQSPYICHTEAHRALPDIMAMENVFTHPSLVACLSELPIRPPKKQRSLWIDQKRVFQRTSTLIKSLGKPAVTRTQAKRLDDLGFTRRDLVKLYADSKDRDVFMKVLKDKGVNSKPLREKLVKLLH